MTESLGSGVATLVIVALMVFIAQPVQAEKVPQRILMLGDSITAGYGLPSGEALPDQLQQQLQEQGYQVQIINGGVSGDTMAQGQARLEWLLVEQPAIVVVALGANDALRGLPVQQMEDALTAILDRLHQYGAKVVLVGMQAPRNLGADYAKAFTAVYRRAAEQYDVRYYPFLLEGVALNPKLNQSDGIHPNRQGVAVIAQGLLPLLRTLLDGEP